MSEEDLSEDMYNIWKEDLMAKKKKPEKDNGVWMLLLSVIIMVTLIALKNKGYFG